MPRYMLFATVEMEGVHELDPIRGVFNGAATAYFLQTPNTIPDRHQTPPQIGLEAPLLWCTPFLLNSILSPSPMRAASSLTMPRYGLFAAVEMEGVLELNPIGEWRTTTVHNLP
uniref:Uncharacterized protein n=1 Tax=Oryza glumipatula TaxID=40148 RepID=A0A0E0ADJ9_9ORYZ